MEGEKKNTKKERKTLRARESKSRGRQRERERESEGGRDAFVHPGEAARAQGHVTALALMATY